MTGLPSGKLHACHCRFDRHFLACKVVKAILDQCKHLGEVVDFTNLAGVMQKRRFDESISIPSPKF